MQSPIMKRAHLDLVFTGNELAFVEQNELNLRVGMALTGDVFDLTAELCETGRL